MMTAYGFESAVEAMKRAPTTTSASRSTRRGRARAAQGRGARALRRENRACSASWRRVGLDTLVGDPAMEEVKRNLRRSPPSRPRCSSRARAGRKGARRPGHPRPLAAGRDPFVAINCGAIPEDLLESELFGHKKGAFTDATADRRGLFEEADGGTLFLDEIGELPLNLQVKLLRVLQEEHIRRLGDTKDMKVDVRIIAATHRDLTADVKAGRFREDLFYRINVLAIHIPPLRSRREDVTLLIDHFVTRNNARLGTNIRGLSPEARKLLLEYAWPGNVRELENTIERAMVMSDGSTLELADFGSLSAAERGPPPWPNGLSIKRGTRALEIGLLQGLEDRRQPDPGSAVARDQPPGVALQAQGVWIGPGSAGTSDTIMT